MGRTCREFGPIAPMSAPHPDQLVSWPSVAAMFWSDKGADPDGWIYKTAEEWKRETGLSYKQQVLVRKKLIEAGVLREHYKRLEHRMLFRVDFAALERALKPEQIEGQFPNLPLGSSRTALSAHSSSDLPGVRSTESTSEITTEVPPISSAGAEDFNPSPSTIPASPTPEDAPPPPTPSPGSETSAEFPDSSHPDFPKLSGSQKRDWVAAVETLDPLSQYFAQLIPGFRWSGNPREARMYYDRRKDGTIKLRQIMLLAKYLRAAHCEKKTNWPPRSMHALLTEFPKVVAGVEKHALANLDILNERMSDLFKRDDEFAKVEFAKARDVVNGHELPRIKALMNAGIWTGLRWPKGVG